MDLIQPFYSFGGGGGYWIEVKPGDCKVLLEILKPDDIMFFRKKTLPETIMYSVDRIGNKLNIVNRSFLNDNPRNSKMSNPNPSKMRQCPYCGYKWHLKKQICTICGSDLTRYGKVVRVTKRGER